MKEDKQLVENYLKTSFDSGWIKIIEFQLNALCNLKCDYCYYGRHLNSATHKDDEEILENVDLMLDYLHENGFLKNISNLEIFSGEPLIQEVGRKATKKIIDFIYENNLQVPLTIPSNGSFVANDSILKKVEDLMEYSRTKGVRTGISLSFDGKYMDHLNRSGVNYTDEYYEKIFSFGKKYRCGFHPMIYYNNIEQWIDNFLWFQEMFKKYDISWRNIYLLEVRNAGWNYKNSKKYMEFIEFILNWIFKNIYGSNKEEFMKDFVFNGKRNINLFNNLSQHGRGIGCSMQHSLQVRMSDLTVNPCHRLSYSELDSFRFKKENGKITDIEPLNVGMYFATRHFNQKNLPFCQDCMVREICSGGCLGSQYEQNNDPFVPIQSVCIVEYAKIKAELNFFIKNGMFGSIINKLSKEKRKSFIEVYNNL